MQKRTGLPVGATIQPGQLSGLGAGTLKQLLCRLLDYYARKRGETVTVLVSTTGDTGARVWMFRQSSMHWKTDPTEFSPGL